MRRSATLILLLALSACQNANPHAGASVGASGASGGVGVDAGRVHAGVGTGGAHGSVDVIDTRNVDVGVGTGGPSASVKVGDSPVRVRVGPHGLRLGI